jgi:hypothetical protein
MDFSSLNQQNEALTRFGQNLFQAGIEQKRTDDDRNNALGLLEFHTWATDQTNATLSKLHQSSYTDLWTDEGNQGDKVLADLSTTFQDRYQAIQSKNPTLALNMRKVSDGLVSEAKQKYSGAFEKKKIDHFLGVYQESFNQSYDEATSTLDSAKRNDAILKFQAKLLTLRQGGIMDENTAAKEFIKFREKVDVSSASQLVRSLNLGTLETAESIAAKINDKGLFPYLNEEDKSKLLYNLSIQDEKYRAQKQDLKLTKVNAQLFQEFGGDYTKIINYLAIPENQAKLGLTLNESNHLITSMGAGRREIEYQKTVVTKEQTEKEVNTIFQYMLDGKNRAALSVVRNSTVLDAQTKFQLVHQLTAPGPEAKTDPATYLALEDKILRRVATPQEVLATPYLSKADKAGLLGKVYAKLDQGQNEVEKETKTFLKSQIIVAKDAFGFGTNPEESENLHKAYMALDFYSNRDAKAGKPWGPAQYEDYAKRLINTFGATQEKKINYMLQSTKTGMPSKLPTTPGVKSTGRKPGESIDAYEKRVGQ